ncbi:MAG: hypothetical protein AABX84_01200 [Nanoarchaeota archaeon]
MTEKECRETPDYVLKELNEEKSAYELFLEARIRLLEIEIDNLEKTVEYYQMNYR